MGIFFFLHALERARTHSDTFRRLCDTVTRRLCFLSLSLFHLHFLFHLKCVGRSLSCIALFLVIWPNRRIEENRMRTDCCIGTRNLLHLKCGASKVRAFQLECSVYATCNQNWSNIFDAACFSSIFCTLTYLTFCECYIYLCYIRPIYDLFIIIVPPSFQSITALMKYYRQHLNSFAKSNSTYNFDYYILLRSLLQWKIIVTLFYRFRSSA